MARTHPARSAGALKVEVSVPLPLACSLPSSSQPPSAVHTLNLPCGLQVITPLFCLLRSPLHPACTFILVCACAAEPSCLHSTAHCEAQLSLYHCLAPHLQLILLRASLSNARVQSFYDLSNPGSPYVTNDG